MEQDNKFVKSLILNAQYGNNSAFEQLYQLNVGRVYALSLRLTANVYSSDELTKNVFVEAWQKISSMIEDITFSSWLVSITINKFLEQVRLKQTAEEKKGNKISEGNVQRPLSDNNLEDAIYDLPENERIVFILNDIEKYSEQDSSDLLALPVEIINENLNKAHSILKEKIEADINANTLPKKIEPAKDLWHDIFNKIHEIKVIQGKEEEELAAIEIEEETEEQREERKRQKEELKKKQKELKKEEVKAKLSDAYKKPQFKGLLAGFILLAAAVIIYLIATSSHSWEVLSSSGSPKMNGESFNGVELMNTGDVLTTGSNASASIKIPNIGGIDVKPNSSLKRLSNENTFELERGSITAIKDNAEEFLHVEIPSAEVNDFYLGGNYDLNVDDGGNSLLHVKDGWILLKGKDKEAFVLKNFFCQIQKDKGIGIPYHSSSSEIFKLALNDYSFSDISGGKLVAILSKAEPKDALSLWHLLKRVNEKERSQVFNTLYGLAPPPKGITQEGILELKEDMMQQWLQVIEWKE